MIEERAQRLALAGLVRQGGEFTLGLREQGVDRPIQRGLHRVERRRLMLEAGVVVAEPRAVQPVDFRDPLDPSFAPLVSCSWPAAQSIKSRRMWLQQNASVTSPPSLRASFL